MQINMSRYQTYEVALEQIPHTIDRKGSKVLGIFLMGFAAFWGGMPAWMFYKMLQEGRMAGDQWFILLFPAIGSLLFLFGLSQFFLHEKWEITYDHILYSKKSLFGNKSWNEPINNYRGVLSTTETRSTGGKNSTTYTVWVIYLHHDEGGKSIKLYESRSKKGVREKWEHYARIFNRPAIEKTGKDFLERDVEDLDKSVREMVREGKIGLNFNAATPPPRGLEVRQEAGGLLVIQHAKQKGLIFAMPLIIAFCGLFVYIGFYAKDNQEIFGYVGYFFLACFVLGLIWELISKPHYALSHSQIHVYRVSPWGPTKGKVFMADNIESINVKRDQNNLNSLVIATDRKQESVGAGLSKEAREWLADCMIYMISQ